MTYKKWIQKNTRSLVGKTVAITGSTGGLGKYICSYLAGLGANLILVDRNIVRSQQHKKILEEKFGGIKVKCITADLEDFSSVKAATELLKLETIDFFIHNAGAYRIPRRVTDAGYANVFQINFVSPYYIIKQLLPNLRERSGRVIAVGSIAHNYSKSNPKNIDFANVKSAAKTYGNAKRYLIFSLYELFKKDKKVSLSVAHPGITCTNITAHYPKLVFAIIKHPMKIIFMRPKKAALSIILGVFEGSEYHEWVGPRLFGIWGKPKKNKLKTCTKTESQQIGKIAEKIYLGL